MINLEKSVLIFSCIMLTRGSKLGPTFVGPLIKIYFHFVFHSNSKLLKIAFVTQLALPYR